MKKKILLIGNTDGLPGVKVDLNNYSAFFQSPGGGTWDSTEITRLIDPSRDTLFNKISLLKAERLDFLIVIFSGHGGQDRETILEINSSGETISESTLKNIATRQINIFDCCRCYPQSTNEGARALMYFSKGGTVTTTRFRYEQRIMQAIPQQISLYSCSIGQVSHDTPTGGLYSNNLIASAKNFNSDFKLVGTAHEEAANLTIAQTRNKPVNERQNPEAILPRCLSSQQLIIGIRP